MKKGAVGVLSLLAGAVGGAIGGAVSVGRTTGAKVQEMQNLADKHLELFLMMNQWVKVKQEGKSLASYFEKNGYKKVAIYGMSYAGETLLDELKNTDIQLAYGIDRKANRIYSDIDVYTMDDALEEVDAVVVTAISFFDQIEEALSEKVNCPIISLEDILYEV